ncbi:MAG: YcxB family protein [Roseovarius sp.]
MSREWQVKVTLTEKPVWQSMVSAGQLYNTGIARLWTILFSLVVMFFAPLGLIITVVAVGHFAGIDARDSLPAVLSWPLPILLLGLGFACIWLSWKPWKNLAAASVKAAFNRTKYARITAKGFCLTGGDSEWHTGWSEVEAVQSTKDALVVVVSAIALIVPRDAFDTPDEAEVALAAMQRWQGAARR